MKQKNDKIRVACVVTHHVHYDSGDVIALFKFHKHAIRYVNSLIKDRDFIKKERDDGVFDFYNDNESYEIKRMEIAQK